MLLDQVGLIGGGFLALAPAFDVLHHGENPFNNWSERESYLLTTYWSETPIIVMVSGPASRHGSLNSLFQVALHLPS